MSSPSHTVLETIMHTSSNVREPLFNHHSSTDECTLLSRKLSAQERPTDLKASLTQRSSFRTMILGIGMRISSLCLGLYFQNLCMTPQIQ
jgi:hypothetical protein